MSKLFPIGSRVTFVPPFSGQEWNATVVDHLSTQMVVEKEDGTTRVVGPNEVFETEKEKV